MGMPFLGLGPTAARLAAGWAATVATARSQEPSRVCCKSLLASRHSPSVSQVSAQAWRCSEVATY